MKSSPATAAIRAISTTAHGSRKSSTPLSCHSINVDGWTSHYRPPQMPETLAPAFADWLDAFLVSYFRRRPVNATFTGIHDYDEELPDLSERGLSDIASDTDHLLRQLEALPHEPLSSSEQLD